MIAHDLFQETIWKNYNSIELFPHQFREYLLSPEVGFSHCRVLDIPQHAAKGFRRPITMFVKGDPSPAHSVMSIDSSTVLPPTVYAQTSCDGASPLSGLTPDANQGSPGPGGLPDTSSAPTGLVPKYHYASLGQSGFTPDHASASPLTGPASMSVTYCASPMSGGYTPDPRSASPVQSGLTPDYSGASPLPSGLTPDPGSVSPDPNSTSPFPSGTTGEYQSASPMSGFVQDTQSASCDTSDGEATRYEAQSREQNKPENVQETYSDGERVWTQIPQFQPHKTEETECVQVIGESGLSDSATDKVPSEYNELKVDSQVDGTVLTSDSAHVVDN